MGSYLVNTANVGQIKQPLHRSNQNWLKILGTGVMDIGYSQISESSCESFPNDVQKLYRNEFTE